MAGIQSIENLIRSFEEVENGLRDNRFIQNSVANNCDIIIEMNREQLYNLGELSTGVRIDSFAPYTPYTIMLKKQKGQPVDRVTLKDTGHFYSQFTVSTRDNDFVIWSKSPLAQDLMSRYSSDIFGLNEDNKKRLRDIVQPDILQQIKQLIFQI